MKFEKTKEDWCFEDEIRTIGYWYYTNDLVTNVSKKKNVYSCNVDKYNTLIKFSNNRKEDIEYVKCNCKYYENKDNFCPHVYALVCYCYNLYKEKSTCDINLIKKFEEYENEQFDEESDELFDKLDAFIESMPIYVLEKALEKTIIDGEDTSILLKNIESKLLKEKKEMDNQVILSSLILKLLNIKNKEKNIVTYNNDYEPYQYEEEELEEDDYYYEDNK